MSGSGPSKPQSLTLVLCLRYKDGTPSMTYVILNVPARRFQIQGQTATSSCVAGIIQISFFDESAAGRLVFGKG